MGIGKTFENGNSLYCNKKLPQIITYNFPLFAISPNDDPVKEEKQRAIRLLQTGNNNIV